MRHPREPRRNPDGRNGGWAQRFPAARPVLWLAFVSLVGVLFLCLLRLDIHRLLAFALFPALVAVLGLAAGRADRRIEPDSQILGIAKWLLGFSLLWLMAVLALGGLASLPDYAKTRSREEACREAVGKVLIAMQTYAAEAGGRFPPARSWREALVPVLRSQGVDADIQLLCPQGFQEWRENGLREASYAFNRSLSTLSIGALSAPEHTVAILESDAGGDAAGGPELLPGNPRHRGGDTYGFADSHVEWLRCRKLGTDSRGNPIWAREPEADWVIWEPVLREDEGGGGQ